jgi:hypothetical protein
MWAQWLIAGAAVVGFVLLLLMALALWRRVKAFSAVLGRAGATLAEATSALESAQSGGSVRAKSERPTPGVHSMKSDLKGLSNG